MRSLLSSSRVLALLFVFFAFLGTAAAETPPVAPTPPDPRLEWLKTNAVRLRSVSPGDRDFSDLQPLKKILDGKRIVLLGEPSHGDGTTFLAKSRLIAFLHEEMGFDVLAFESGLYDCRKVDEALRKGEDPVKAVRRGLFGIWSRSEQLLPLIGYLGREATSKSPMAVAGFDNQFTGNASYESFVKDLEAYFLALGSKSMVGPEAEAFGGVVQKLIDGTWEEQGSPLPPAAEQERFLARLGGLRNEVRAQVESPPKAKREGAPSAEENAFWLQMLASLDSIARVTWEPEGTTTDGRLRTRKMRDRQMAQNLLWLANERYPGKKIVVWAATFHAARNLGKIDVGTGREELARSYRSMETMGDGVSKALGERIYTLGFTAFEGSIGNVFQSRPPEPLDPPSPGSLEELMARAGLENALVDFRNPPKGGEWLRQPLLSRPLGYTEMNANWGEIVDGMLFTKKMEPSRRAAEKETSAPPPHP